MISQHDRQREHCGKCVGEESQRRGQSKYYWIIGILIKSYKHTRIPNPGLEEFRQMCIFSAHCWLKLPKIIERAGPVISKSKQ